MAGRQKLLDKIAKEEARLAGLKAEVEESSSRLANLREQLDTAAPVAPVSLPVTMGARSPTPATNNDKVALFRSLFRGRDDVFPRRWENKKTGKSGYSPACDNEWEWGLCEKKKKGGAKRATCGECPNQAFIRVSDGEVARHLSGDQVMGVYPLLPDETCLFLAADFDKKEWQEDISAFTETCRLYDMPVAIERSRSGNGAHAWFFFASPMPAIAARKHGCFLITETMSRRHQLSMESYDRLFPNQDNMPKGGFGNLIALPLQREARKTASSVFVDESFKTWPDQWEFLANVKRIDSTVVRHISAVSFERVLTEVKAKYVVGLTATPQRRDGRHPILPMQLGPVRFRVDARSQAAKRPFDHKLVVRQTGFSTIRLSEGAGIQEIYAALAMDKKRNELIFDDVVRALDEKRSPILLTERRDHLEHFAKQLQSFTRHLVVLHGGMKPKERREVVARLATIPDGEERLLIATGRYIGEGFDDARLDTLFLALPVSWKGTLIQYTGRLHRLHPNKTEVRIYDYVDQAVPMLMKMFEKRLRGYRAIGYARDEAPLGLPEADSDPVVEYDEHVLRDLEEKEL